MVKRRRRLKSQVGNGKEEKRKDEKSVGNKIREFKIDPGNIKTIMLNWSFTDSRQVPWNLPEKENGKKEECGYVARRITEVLQSGGGIAPEAIETQRANIMDTGIHLLEAKHCEGGLTLVNQLLGNDWKITDAWFSKRESEQSKTEQKGHTKFRVRLFLSREGQEMKLKETTCKGIERLLRDTWIVHIWDNRKVNNGITVNFTFNQRDTPFETKISL